MLRQPLLLSPLVMAKFAVMLPTLDLVGTGLDFRAWLPSMSPGVTASAETGTTGEPFAIGRGLASPAQTQPAAVMALARRWSAGGRTGELRPGGIFAIASEAHF